MCFLRLLVVGLTLLSGKIILSYKIDNLFEIISNMVSFEIRIGCKCILKTVWKYVYFSSVSPISRLFVILAYFVDRSKERTIPSKDGTIPLSEQQKNMFTHSTQLAMFNTRYTIIMICDLYKRTKYL